MADKDPTSTTVTLTYLLMLVGVLIWGGNWVAAKVSVGAVPPFTLATLRYLVATPLLFAWLASQGPLPRPERRDWPRLAALGILFVGVSNLLFLYGLRYAPSVDGAIIYPGFQPLLASVLAAYLLGEALIGRQFLGFGVAIGGLVLVVGGGGAIGAGGEQRLLGDMLFLVGAAVWAYTNILMRILGRRFSGLAVTTYSALIALPLLLLCSLWEGGWGPLWEALPAIWPALFYMAAISTGPPTIFFYNGIRRLGIARASAITYLIPVSGVTMTAIFLGERLEPIQIGGGVLVLLGLWLVSRRARTTITPASPLRQESRP